jgi:hypothetical protein
LSALWKQILFKPVEVKPTKPKPTEVVGTTGVVEYAKEFYPDFPILVTTGDVTNGRKVGRLKGSRKTKRNNNNVDVYDIATIDKWLNQMKKEIEENAG